MDSKHKLPRLLLCLFGLLLTLINKGKKIAYRYFWQTSQTTLNMILYFREEDCFKWQSFVS